MVWCEMSPIRERANAPPGSSIPDTRALPDVGLSNPASTRSRVVFPAPFGPNTAGPSRAERDIDPPATARLGPNARASSFTSTIGTAAGVASLDFFEDIRLELATLAGAAQNDVSLKIRRCADDQPLCANDRHRCPVRGKSEVRPAKRVQADRQRQQRQNLRPGSPRSGEVLGGSGARA